MVLSQTKNPNLGKFWRAFEWKMLVYLMTIGNIIWPLGIIYSRFSLLSYGIFFPFWYVWTKKNLATLTLSIQVRTA
jgi:hypothetical protein